MEIGETVILVNSSPIHSSFYDVFNKHFTVIATGTVDDDKAKREDLEENFEEHDGKGKQKYLVHIKQNIRFDPEGNLKQYKSTNAMPILLWDHTPDLA